MKAVAQLKVGLIQMRCEKAALKQNLRRHADYIAEAAERGVDIIGFPEMSITGYADPTRFPEAIIRLDGPEVGQLVEMTKRRRLTVLAGLIEENPVGKPYITQIAARDGRLLGHYRKRTIEDDEVDWFAAGDEVPVFTHGAVAFGLAICADIGNESVFADCARQGAEIVFELAAPGLYGEQTTRDWRAGYEWWEGECLGHLSQYAKTYGLWIAVATQAGRTVDEDFPGGGYVFVPDGRRVYATADWQPGAVYLALDLATAEVMEL
jgi:predicted amidohydrolase